MLLEYLALTLPGGQSIEAPASIKDKQGGLEFLGVILGNVMSMLLTVGIVITLIIIIWSGIQWTNSGGNPQKVASARARLTWAVIGLVVMLSTFFIMALLSYFFNVNLLKFG